MANKHIEETWHWRNSMRTVRFFNLDGRAGFFVLLLVVHARTATLLLLLTVFTVLLLFERRGLSFTAAMRAIRVWFIGKERPALVYTRRNKMRDKSSA